MEPPAARLRVGIFIWPGYEPFFLARSMGYYDESKIQLVEFTTSPEMVMSYRNGSLDAITVTVDDLLRLAADGHASQAILMLDASNGADAIVAPPSITNVFGLKGKKIAVESGGLGGYVLARALSTASLTLGDVKVVSNRMDRFQRDLATKGVDAAVVYEPYLSTLRKKKMVTIFDSTSMPGEIMDLLIAKKETIEKSHEVLENFIVGWFRAMEHLKKDPQDAVRRMAPREHVTPEEFEQSLAGLTFFSLSENRKMLGTGPDNLSTRMRGIAAFMEQQQMIPAGVKSEQLFTDKLLPKESP